MASSLLTKFIQPVGAIFGSTGQSGPVASVLGDDTGFVDPWAQQSSGPRGFVQESVEWSPARESLATQIGSWQQREAQAAYEKQLAANGTWGTGNQGTVGSMASLGGDWAMVDQWNSAIDAASRKYGVPANLIKAVMKLESGGRNLGRNGAGAIGPMQVVDTYWGNKGYDLYDPAQNIMAGAMVLKSMYDQWSGWATQNGVDPWQAASYGYYAGNPYNLLARDDPGQGGSGITTQDYGARIWADYRTLNQAGGGTNPGYSWATPEAQSVINAAQQYVGVQYVWGGIPGKGQNPWETGWDCSGMTYWLDQNYGTGELPMGSHYQYDYAQRTGRLFTDMNQLQPGDLVFINTGWQGGAGANLNAAGHVGMYIGNGKMIHAANAQQGTIISDLAAYGQSGMQILGAMHQSWSGGSGGYIPGQTYSAGRSAPSSVNQRFLNLVAGRR